jgi:hypothetical protein
VYFIHMFWSFVIDYNPSNGDTISGKCTLINTIGEVPTNMPGIDLPETGNEGTASTIAPG